MWRERALCLQNTLDYTRADLDKERELRAHWFKAFEQQEALAQEWRDAAEHYRQELQILRDRSASQTHAAPAGSDPQTGGAGEGGEDLPRQGRAAL